MLTAGSWEFLSNSNGLASTAWLGTESRWVTAHPIAQKEKAWLPCSGCQETQTSRTQDRRRPGFFLYCMASGICKLLVGEQETVP